MKKMEEKSGLLEKLNFKKMLTSKILIKCMLHQHILFKKQQQADFMGRLLLLKKDNFNIQNKLKKEDLLKN